MPKRTTLFLALVFAGLFANLPLTIQLSRAEPAADECISGPNKQAPEGSHWYYRVDRQSQRKCWHLGPAGQKVRDVAAPKADQVAKTAARPAAAAPTEPPVAQARTESVPAPAAQVPSVSTFGASSTPWLAAPPQPPASEAVPVPSSNPEPETASTVAIDEPATPQPAVTPVKQAAVESVAPIDSKLAVALLAAALAVAGVVGRATFKHSASRRALHRLDRREPSWHSPRTEDIAPPMFADVEPVTMRDHNEPPRPEDEIERLLRELERDWKRSPA